MDGFNMDNSDGIKSLMEFIDEDANPPVQQKPYWLFQSTLLIEEA